MKQRVRELFRSPDAVFYLSYLIRGMLGFARDGYLNTFSHRIHKGCTKATIGISGDRKVDPSTYQWTGSRGNEYSKTLL